MKKTLLRSQELSCPSCVAKIETALKALNGVADAKDVSTQARSRSSMIRRLSNLRIWSKR